ncbi:hypothetical protein SHIRM173S_01762 [Streptomyces hirsutus]
MPTALDRYFKISERGSTLPGRSRGGFATFFAMAYIIVLNPIILGSAKDMYGHQLDTAAGHRDRRDRRLHHAPHGRGRQRPDRAGRRPRCELGHRAPAGARMSWPDAMGMVVLAGFIVMLLVATGLRERVMNAVPFGLRKAISIGIGLFIMLIGLVDSGFVSRIPDAAQTTVPLQLGADGGLQRLAGARLHPGRPVRPGPDRPQGLQHDYLAAFAVGLATVVDNPARQTLAVVGARPAQNAVSMNSANFQSARLVGPAVAGVMITGVGTGWAFLANGLSFVAPLIGLMMMRTHRLSSPW